MVNRNKVLEALEKGRSNSRFAMVLLFFIIVGLVLDPTLEAIWKILSILILIWGIYEYRYDVKEIGKVIDELRYGKEGAP